VFETRLSARFLARKQNVRGRAARYRAPVPALKPVPYARGLVEARGLAATGRVLGAIALVGASSTARAEGVKSFAEGDRYGALVPLGATRLRVERASLVLAIARDLDRASATASFEIVNPTEALESIDVAFASVRAPGDDAAHEPGYAIEVDGAPVAARATSDAELLAPKLRAWTADHEPLASQLRASSHADLAALLGTPCERGCTALGAWLRGDHLPLPGAALDAGARAQDADAPHAAEADDRAADDRQLVEAAREVIPDDVARLVDPWAAREEHRTVRFLVVHLDVRPREPCTVTVHYDHRAAIDRSAHVRSTFEFEEQLAPERAWAAFGPLDLTVRVPWRARVKSNVGDLEQVGDTYAARLPPGAPPSGSLRVDVMSTEGLWLGMTEPRGYWAIALAAFTTIAASVGSAAAATWPRSATSRGAWARLLAAAPLALVCNLAVLTLLLVAFPEHALGFGYRAIAAGVGAAALSGLVAVVAAALAGRRSGPGAAATAAAPTTPAP
jgi:hypothetical protein